MLSYVILGVILLKQEAEAAEQIKIGRENDSYI